MALLLEYVERSGDLAGRQQFDGRFQSRVLLPNDVVQRRRTHSGLLQLLEGSARFHALMLADIADQKHAVIGVNSGKELSHLLGAGKARFIDEVEVLSLCGVWICSAGEEALQGSGFNSCLIQLTGGAGGRGEALDLITLPFRGAADHCQRGRLA